MHTPRYPVFWNEFGRPFRLRLLSKGGRYGLRWSLVHEKNDPLVEIYDASHGSEDGFIEFGQLVERYRCALLLGTEDDYRGLPRRPIGGSRIDVVAGVRDWTLDGSVTMQIERWLRAELSTGREPERFVLWCDECKHCYPHMDEALDESGWGPACCSCHGPRMQLRMVCEIEKGELIV